jgi:hypothetical protein
MQHRAGIPNTRLCAYALLRIAAAIVGLVGLRGLVLLLDEVESVHTKLPNVRSRLGAYRVLAALCQSVEFQDFKTVVAITPDAIRSFMDDVSLMVSDTDALPCEPIATWARTLVRKPNVFECRPLNQVQRTDLIGRICALYGQTYGGLFSESGLEGVAALGDVDVPIRMIIRRVMDLLDSRRYGSAKSP